MDPLSALIKETFPDYALISLSYLLREPESAQTFSLASVPLSALLRRIACRQAALGDVAFALVKGNTLLVTSSGLGSANRLGAYIRAT